MIPRYVDYRGTSHRRDYPITRRKAESIMHDYFPAARHATAAATAAATTTTTTSLAINFR